MGVRRFAGEVSRKRAGNKVYISETLLDPRTGRVDKTEADALTDRLFEHLDSIAKVKTPITEDKVQAEATSLAAKLNYDYETLSVKLHISVRPGYEKMSNPVPLPRIQRIAVAYSHDGPASLDLVGAILRQGAFVEKMVHIGWTQPGSFEYEHNLAPLVRSIARYHAFLDLMRAHPTTLLVPTLDIDLAWHSHQLKGEAYRESTLKYLYRTPNHDDSVESFVLAKGYDSTAKAWKKRFGVPYSLCGCIPDKDTESTISRLASKITHIGKKDKEEEPVLPVNTRPDLITVEDDEADSSHPSEHNLLFDNPGSVMNSVRIDSRQKVSMKCVASAKKGASRDPWRALQAERSERRKNNERHREAFTDPYYGYGYYYPYWGVSTPYPPGFYAGYGYSGSCGSGPAGCGSGCAAAGCGGGACSGGCGGGGCGGGGCGS
ncbi:hypothetical protein M408DRAFT_328973 [Serendipita vermifera MAFF 305830]|uniref:Uncharacterized protein n=1 Tax=Serendipita vermifera MAFF 305830 TaxID=933852 RepID=A0A0C3BB40_SERVB|nr:hypothetical protein M408DRAFT_328973 [Serendipita vermifera MAFF 305830]